MINKKGNSVLKSGQKVISKLRKDATVVDVAKRSGIFLRNVTLNTVKREVKRVKASQKRKMNPFTIRDVNRMTDF